MIGENVVGEEGVQSKRNFELKEVKTTKWFLVRSRTDFSYIRNVSIGDFPFSTILMYVSTRSTIKRFTLKEDVRIRNTSVKFCIKVCSKFFEGGSIRINTEVVSVTGSKDSPISLSLPSTREWMRVRPNDL